MAVCRSLFVNRAAKVKLFNDCGGTEIETCKQHLFKLCIGHCSRSESVNTDGDGFCNADSIGKLNFAAFCIALCNDILCRITCRIGSGPVNLCGILSGEAAAAVSSDAAVGINDYLSAGQAGIALRSADNEPSRWVYKNSCLRINKLCGNNGTNDGFDNVTAQPLRK